MKEHYSKIPRTSARNIPDPKYCHHPTFHTCQATNVSLPSAVVRIGCVIPCEFALMHFCFLFLFRFSHFDISEFT
jgi:hypothetical protein